MRRRCSGRSCDRCCAAQSGSVPGAEDQTGVDPAVSRVIAVGVLLLLADLQSGHAQVGQRQRSLRCLGLDLPADELVTDTLKLLPHVQLSSIEVDPILRQAEDFTSTQAKDEDQDEGRVQRFTSMPRGFKAAPRGPLTPPTRRPAVTPAATPATAGQAPVDWREKRKISGPRLTGKVQGRVGI